MNPGHTERRQWTSADGRRSEQIDVYIPVPLADQRVSAGKPKVEARTERALQSLREHGALRPLAPTLLRSEGIASSRIEGEIASTRRVFEAEYAPDGVIDPQAQRIVNSIAVMTEVMTTADEGLAPTDLDQWHASLFHKDVVAFAPGRVRERQSWIGTRTDSPVGAEFIPPPPEIVNGALLDLAEFVNRVDVSPLTQAAVAHAQFETIHPYPDGNGRIGRALVYRSWAYRGVVGDVAPPISKVLVEDRDAYVAGLTAYREGDLDGWLDYFHAVTESAVSYTRSLGVRLDSLVRDWEERLSGTHEDSLSRRVVAELAARPILSSTDVATRHDVTERGARAALDDLAEREIVTLRSPRKPRRGRPTKVYEATELFALLDLSPQDLA